MNSKQHVLVNAGESLSC